MDAVGPPSVSEPSTSSETMTQTSKNGATVKGNNVLKRNSACLTCRTRKVKCDALQPICSPCLKSAKSHGIPPEQVGCVYDERKEKEPVVDVEKKGKKKRKLNDEAEEESVEGANGSGAGKGKGKGKERVKALEDKIAELERLIKEQVTINNSRSNASPQMNASPPTISPAPLPSDPSSSSPNMGMSSVESLLSFNPSNLLQGGGSITELVNNGINGHANGNGNGAPNLMAGAGVKVGGSPPSTPDSSNSGVWDILLPGWSSTLPSPATVQILVEAFFARDHAARNHINRSKLLRNLRLPPSHPQFPHLSLLHAICSIGSKFVNKETFGLEAYWLRDGSPEDYHARNAKEAIDDAISRGVKLFQVAQAVNLVGFWAYSNARFVEVWLYCGLATRVSTPLGLNHLEGFYVNEYGGIKKGPDAGGKPSLLPPPKDAEETYERACTFWTAFTCDRFASASTGWANSLDEADISTLLPIPPGADMGSYTHADSPLSISSPNFFTLHPPSLVTSFQLHLKATVLLGRVATFIQRSPWPISMNLSRGVAFEKPKSDVHVEEKVKYMQSVPIGTPLIDIRDSLDFKKLDSDAVKFRMSIPKPYSNILGRTETGQIDSNLVTAHTLPHVCTILLHEPFCTIQDNCTSLQRCLTSARAILANVYLLWSSSYEIALLNPFICFCWSVAGRTLIRELAIQQLKGVPLTSLTSIRDEIEIIISAMTAFRAPLGLCCSEGLRRMLENPATVLTGEFGMGDKGEPLGSIKPCNPGEYWKDPQELLAEQKEIINGRTNNIGGVRAASFNSYFETSDGGSPEIIGSSTTGGGATSGTSFSGNSGTGSPMNSSGVGLSSLNSIRLTGSTSNLFQAPSNVSSQDFSTLLFGIENSVKESKKSGVDLTQWLQLSGLGDQAVNTNSLFDPTIPSTSNIPPPVQPQPSPPNTFDPAPSNSNPQNNFLNAFQLFSQQRQEPATPQVPPSSSDQRAFSGTDADLLLQVFGSSNPLSISKEDTDLLTQTFGFSKEQLIGFLTSEKMVSQHQAQQQNERMGMNWK